MLHSFRYLDGPAEFTAPKADSINRSTAAELAVSLGRCVRQVTVMKRSWLVATRCNSLHFLASIRCFDYKGSIAERLRFIGSNLAMDGEVAEWPKAAVC